MHELYKKHRPTLFKNVLGQSNAVKQLEAFLKKGKLPHTLLLCGPSGVGKTTLARILKTKLECGDSDFYEMNTADFRGIEMVRDIRSVISLAPMFGKCRIWLLDEVHGISRDASEAFLKLLEDTPNHVYFFLCTTEPNKLKPTIISRSYRLDLSPLDDEAMGDLVRKVADKENIDLSEEVLKKLIEVSRGSARKALVLLEQIATLDDEQERLDILLKGDPQKVAFDLVKALLYARGKSSWKDVKKVLEGLNKDDDPEQLRRFVLACASTELLKGTGTADKAYLVISAFEENFFNSGRAGLIRACWECCTAKD